MGDSRGKGYLIFYEVMEVVSKYWQKYIVSCYRRAYYIQRSLGNGKLLKQIVHDTSWREWKNKDIQTSNFDKANQDTLIEEIYK